MKNKNEFYSASFEARIAVEQMIVDYSIEIIPESDEHRKKIHDFRVTTSPFDGFKFETKAQTHYPITKLKFDQEGKDLFGSVTVR